LALESRFTDDNAFPGDLPSGSASTEPPRRLTQSTGRASDPSLAGPFVRLRSAILLR